MGTNTLGRNITLPIYNADGTSFNELELTKFTSDSVVMSLADKITGDVYYKDNGLSVAMTEYVLYNGVKYVLVNPPTVVREGMASDNGELKGMTKYSFEFYHPMYQLSNLPFTDVAVTSSEEKYLSQNKNFSWVGYPSDFFAKLNKNLESTQWIVVKSTRYPSDKETMLSGVLSFNDNTIADALKMAYDTWGVAYVISQIKSGEQYYSDGKRFMVTFGLPTNEIYASDDDRNNNNPYIFEMGKGVGLKNNSRTPRKNKIVTRISGYGSEDNIPYGYPQIVWTGNQDWDYTINNDSTNPNSYPIYNGIVNGAYVKLIKHPFTRTHLMPSVYAETVNKKVNPNATGYDPTIEIKDYYDAIGDDYPNPINTLAPSYDIHEFNDIKPELGQVAITGVQPINNDKTIASDWDDSINDNGKYGQEYFQITLPILDFDIYACAAITQQMQINMRSGACIGCTFTVQVDWDDYRKNFYTQDGDFAPQGEQRDLTKYPNSTTTSVTLILQKDTQTFGTLMPNIYQKPKSGDEFVVLGISMPLSYITNAETRLDNAMMSYMLENNIYYFDYPLKFDEHFLATHTHILEQIHPNSVVHFKYGNETLELFVKQLTIKYGQSVLPQYDITLADNVEVVLNQIGQVADSVEHLSSLISILRQGYNQNVFLELARKLSKTGNDTAQGVITFLKGIVAKAKSFFTGIVNTGSIENTGDIVNTGDITTKNLTVTGLARFFKLVIDHIKSVGGAYISSPADGFEIDKVDPLYTTVNDVRLLTSAGKYLPSNGSVLSVRASDSSDAVPVRYRLYWRATDGSKTRVNMWQAGDQALSMDFNKAREGTSTAVANNYWWSCVLAVSSEPVKVEIDGEDCDCHYIEISHEGSDVDGVYTASVNTQGWDAYNKTKGAKMWDGAVNPSVGDTVAMLGHRFTSNADKDYSRQSAVYESCYASLDRGITPPLKAFYKGIDDFDLPSHRGTYSDAYGSKFVGRFEVVSQGSDGTTTKSLDDYIGEKASASSVQYVLNLSPSVIHVGQDGTMSASSITPKVTKIEGGKGTVSWSATEAWKNGLGVAYKSSRMGVFVWIGNKEEEENKLLFEKLSAVEKVTHIEFQLYSGSQIVDTKYVPFVREAKDGEPGDPGTPGKDGKDAYEVVCTPQSLVFDTDDNGTLDGEDYKTVQVSLQNGGHPVDISGKVRLVDGSCINIAGDGIEFGDGPTITVWPNAIDSDDNSVACTSASFMIAIDFDGRTYYYTVLISVNVQAYMSRIDSDAKQYKREFEQFKGGEESLTEYGSKLLQTAREFSVEMSEKEDRRNLLAGTMFRRRKEIGWNNGDYPCMISTSVPFRGTNSMLIDCAAETKADGSAKGKWQGVTWNHIKVTPGKMYQWSFWYRTRTKDLTTEVKAFDANGKELNRPVSINSLAGTNTDGTWHLFKVNFIPTDGTVTVNAEVYIIYSGKAYVARPMLEEADDYGGWTPSAQDDDYIGGNLIANTRTLEGENIILGTGTTHTTDGYNGAPTLSRSGTNVGICTIELASFEANTEYMLSVMAKGSGHLAMLMDKGIYFAEDSNGQESGYSEYKGNSTQTGYTEMAVGSDWKRYWLHFKTRASETPKKIFFVTAGNSSITVAQIKLEKGATATDWTDSPETFTYPAGSYGSLFNMTARQIEMSVTDGARKAGLTLGANGGFTATANNFWVKNSSGETIAAVDADGNMQAGSLTTKNKNGQYARIDGTGFELGKTENGSNKVYFDLVQNTNGEAVLRYLDGSGNVIGYIDKNFFNSKSYGDTWTMMQLRWLGSGTDISMSYSQLAEEIALAASGVAQTCYKFNAGFTLSANGTKIYNYTGNSNAPAFENCVYKNKYADASSLGSFANMIEDGWYVSARPLGGLSGNAYDFWSGLEFIVVYRFVGGKYSQSKIVAKNQ